MKLRFIYTLFAVGLIYLVLQSASAGRGAAGGLDRTGSPLSGGALCS